MASFEMTCDVETGIVHCRFSGFLPDAEVDDLVRELTRAMHAARRRYGRLRMFVDNRQGTVFSTRATTALAVVKSVYDPKDRTAVLVPTGLRKLQAERNVSDQTRVFLSEAEAMDWLKAGDEAAEGNR
jgi:hypothetical protein